jgi:hypothetical protein
VPSKQKRIFQEIVRKNESSYQLKNGYTAIPSVGILIKKQQWIRKLDEPILKIYTNETLIAEKLTLKEQPQKDM